jgi:hypothetical protein
LSLALVWYSINPVPIPTIRLKRDNEPPDEKKRNLEPNTMSENLSVAFKSIVETSGPLSSADENEDDFEWPEFIDG